MRIFAWKIILGDQGLFNSALFELGLRDPDNPVSFLIYSQFTVILVLLYAWVPFIILPIFIALETVDRRLLEAATDMGASRLQALRKITLPIAAPGIVAAFLFVFIPSIGEYVTPSLVGGNGRLHVRAGDRESVRGRRAQLADGLRALDLPPRRRPLPRALDVEVPACGGGATA